MSLMCKWFRAQSILEAKSSFLFREVQLIYDSIKKFAPFTELHDDVEVPGVFIDCVQFYDVRVVHLQQNFTFPFERMNVQSDLFPFRRHAGESPVYKVH